MAALAHVDRPGWSAASRWRPISWVHDGYAPMRLVTPCMHTVRFGVVIAAGWDRALTMWPRLASSSRCLWPVRVPSGLACPAPARQRVRRRRRHYLLVPDDLDDVAVRLAQQTLAIRSSNNRLGAWSDRRGDLVGTVAGLVGAAAFVVSILRRIGGLPDQVETRRLYERAADVGRDRANADTGLVTERLVPLVAAWDGPTGDELVLAASRRLVAWVAAGRPHDHRMAGTEAAFTRWVDVQEAKDPSPEALKERTDAYIEAWDASLRPAG